VRSLPLALEFLSGQAEDQFCITRIPNITGGQLAILEYANRFADQGHKVSVTTNPRSMWNGDSPFPWFDLKAKVHFLDNRGREQILLLCIMLKRWATLGRRCGRPVRLSLPTHGFGLG
jgi:hypothetical protein